MPRCIHGSPLRDLAGRAIVCPKGCKYKHVVFNARDVYAPLPDPSGVSEGKDWDGADLAGVNPQDYGPDPGDP